MRCLLLLLTIVAACGSDPESPPTPRPDAGTCDLVPLEGGCCFDDQDCPAAERCYDFSCTAGGDGRCKAPAGAGMCWDDGDCSAGSTCQGVQLCQCGARCLVDDSPGTCS